MQARLNLTPVKCHKLKSSSS